MKQLMCQRTLTDPLRRRNHKHNDSIIRAIVQATSTPAVFFRCYHTVVKAPLFKPLQFRDYVRGKLGTKLLIPIFQYNWNGIAGIGARVMFLMCDCTTG